MQREAKKQSLWTEAIVGKTAYQQHVYIKAYASDTPDTKGFQDNFVNSLSSLI
jgi:hypothetical protein